MLTDYTISEDLQQELQRFFGGHNITLLKENLRRLLVDFLDYQLQTGVPLYFNEFLYPFNSLLDVLDEAGKEIDAFEWKQKQQQIYNTKEKVIAFIKASLSPEKIFLLHHEKKQELEHFDFLVVVPESSQINFNQYEQVISMANIEHASITASLHKSAMLQKQLEEGHIYFSLNCIKENLVYDNGTMPLPQANDAALQLIKEKATHAFYTGFKKAESFLQGASNFYGEKDSVMTTFMLQQAAEITLRGLITALLGNCPRTHCFNELKKPLKRCAPELHYVLSANETEENRLLHLLEKAYLESRYADTFDISDNDVGLLVEGVETLHEKAEKIFRKRINILEAGK